MTDVSISSTRRWHRLEHGAIVWWVVTAVVLLCLIGGSRWTSLAMFPQHWSLPIAAWIDIVTAPVFAFLQPGFRELSALLNGPLDILQALLQWLPWPAICLALTLVAGRAGGFRLAAFAIITCLYILLSGYWQPSMNTLATILFAVPLSVAIGFGLGVLSFRLPRWRPTIETCLDLMQTVPAFAYLIPLLLLFGFGPVVGLISSAIYAIPPMVRNTSLGLELVAGDIREAGTMSGSNKRQLFWLVEIPCALPQLLVGINQTTMAAFSMVIIASIIGGFADIGWAVLDAMRKAEFGQSLLSGGVIALMAMVMDRVTHGFSLKRSERPLSAALLAGKRYWFLLLAAVLLAAVLRFGLAQDSFWLQAPTAWINADSWNAVILMLVQRYGDILEAVKNGVFYALLLPLRLGFAGVATPYVWGITLTPLLQAIYWAAIAFLAWLASRPFGWRGAVFAIITGGVLYSGFASLPWLILPIIVTTLAARLAGRRLAVLVAASLGFMLVSGLWPALMQSLYLCGLAILFSVAIGGSLGIWAAHNNRVSTVLRAICDALQTMPQFVFLIPVLMFFKVGEFTALIAIMLYAVVPPIRYGEHALRTVPTGLVEAGQQMGCTGRQMLWLVKMPAALPVIMLGINQTIMAALSMLVIAAMVGTRDLGQQVYIALGKADAGLGLVSGLAIALLAIMTDRMIKAWQAQRTLKVETAAS
jgi:glycine betaine/proline transport system permease protein